ncbi:MAG: glycosyltransferase family 39 protein [Neisseria sp.]|nr:glycosyltransferase family 39 protein [Neisseria sp.]
MNKPRLYFWLTAVIYVITWVGISCVMSPGLDSYGDMVENYAWSQTWMLGTFKHPPFFAWMVKAWFALFPTEVWAYYVLSYLNALVGILGIVCLARLWLPENLSAARRGVFVFVVLLFALLSAPYSNLASKFNADTVLLSLWPWTAYAFFAALHEERFYHKWAFTVLLGVLAAAAMLSKYFTVILLVTLLLISVSNAQYRQWWRTRYPYVAFGVFIALMLPHLVWEIWHGFPFRQYVGGKITEGVSVRRVFTFPLSGIYYLPLSWIAWWLLRRRFSAPQRQELTWKIPRRSLVLLSFLPALLVVLVHIITHVHLTTHWAIPIWFALPALMAVWLLPLLSDDFAWRRLLRGLGVFWAAYVGVTAVVILFSAILGDYSYTHGMPQMAQAIDKRFAERYPGQKLSWVAGAWPRPGAVSFFGKDHPRGLPSMPDKEVSQVNPYPEWKQTYGAVLCMPYRSGGCERAVRNWLHEQQLGVEGDVLHYQAEGWQFIRSDVHDLTVFWVRPSVWE